MSYRLTTTPPLFEALFRDILDGAPRTTPPEGRLNPAVELVEHGDLYQLRVELPGFDPSKLELAFEGRTLTLSGEKQLPSPEEGAQVHLQERRAGSFERRFAFPAGVDGASIEAKFERGVLEVRVAKRPEAQPRKIEIQLAD